jgi:hypothetical protein
VYHVTVVQLEHASEHVPGHRRGAPFREQPGPLELSGNGLQHVPAPAKQSACSRLDWSWPHDACCARSSLLSGQLTVVWIKVGRSRIILDLFREQNMYETLEISEQRIGYSPNFVPNLHIKNVLEQRTELEEILERPIQTLRL